MNDNVEEDIPLTIEKYKEIRTSYAIIFLCILLFVEYLLVYYMFPASTDKGIGVLLQIGVVAILIARLITILFNRMKKSNKDNLDNHLKQEFEEQQK